MIVPVDTLTDYSVLASLVKIEDLVSFAKSNGMKYLGIADYNAGGLLDFYLACEKEGIKPILGLRFYITKQKGQFTSDQVLLYARNENGYRNLLRLSTRANIDGIQNGRAILLIDWFTPEICEDLVCVLPIGESPNESKNENGALVIKALQTLFNDRIFLGLYDRNCALDDYYLRVAKNSNIGFLPLNASKYLKPDDIQAYKVLRCIATHTTLNYLFDVVYLDESLDSFCKRELPTYCQATVDRFVNLFDVKIPTPGLKVPKLKIPAGFPDSYEYLVHLCRLGYKAKSASFTTQEAKDQCAARLKIEFDVIKRCKLADYFLLVYDICRYCDENKIPRGTARGSCAGSLIVYLLDISRVNPLSYNLLFERFLNEDRTKPIQFNGEDYLTDAPDIDLDVGQIQRQQIVDYLRNEYGNVAKICTYTTLSAKACIKDCIRAFSKPEVEANYVSSMIEIIYGRSDSLADTFKKNEKFRAWVAKNKVIYDIALKLEDAKKNSSVHAAGLVVSNSPIEDRAPLFLANYGEDGDFKKDVCIGYSLDFAAKAGLLKMDLLGLRCLNVLQDTIKLIN